METFPLMRGEAPAGELTVSREALYTWFDADCRRQDGGLWCAWIVGEKGQLRLGVLEPSGDRAVIRRRFSHRFTDPLGPILRCEIRPVSVGEADWKPAAAPEALFRTPWLRQQLEGTAGVLTRDLGQGREIAVPFRTDHPFPLPGLFCFARCIRIREETYAAFSFNGEETPVFEL